MFVGPNFSSDKIFVTSKKFRHFCPTKFSPIRYVDEYVRLVNVDIKPYVPDVNENPEMPKIQEPKFYVLYWSFLY